MTECGEKCRENVLAGKCQTVNRNGLRSVRLCETENPRREARTRLSQAMHIARRTCMPTKCRYDRTVSDRDWEQPAGGPPCRQLYNVSQLR